MTEQQLKAILTALKKGFRVELTQNKDGSIKARTVMRKELKT